jgi:phytoene synthase
MSTSRSSFYWPMRLTNEPQRSGLFAIYAWCRHMDDVVDGPLPAADKAAELATWRSYFADDGAATKMRGEAALLAATVGAAMATFRLDTGPFLSVLDGLEMDLAGDMRAPLLSTLEQYAHGVAGAPGELCLNVLGWRGEDAARFSRILGEAVQYTNILRDVEEDAAQGRLYIPREALDSAGIDAADPAIVLADRRFADAWLALALMAEAKFQQADSLRPARTSVTDLRPALAMMDVYRILHGRIRRRGWRHASPKVVLPAWRIIVTVLRIVWFGSR